MTQRADRLLERLPELGAEAMLVTNLVNVRYLTGYTGSNGMALIGPSTRTFITDFRYVEQAADEVDPSFGRVLAQLDLAESLPDALAPGNVTLGFEEGHVTVRQHRRLRELLPSRVELVGIDGAVEGLRAVKDAEEVARIRAASELADAAFERLLSDGLVGRTEREAAIALESAMRELGATRPSFDSIVAAGAHGALPHAHPREVEIEPGVLVVIDWGAELDGYCSDCTRTVATGELDEQALEVYALVLAAQLAALGAVRAGAGGRELDAVARDIITAAGHGDSFGHGLGHGVGIEIHEAPRLSKRSEDVLRAGNIVTVEPGVYLPGKLGVRIEDLLAVTAGGSEILTTLPKELRTVD
jgi:Xaa-Pro aminopeptidase